jgi:hypothetical protein
MTNSAERQDIEASKDEEEYKGKEKPSQGSTLPATKSTQISQPKFKPNHEKRTTPIPEVPMEDWRLVRSAQGHAGWIPARIIDVDIPLDIAQYAEGQRIVAFFRLTTVHDSELNKDEAYYLVLLTDPKDGMPFDYNQVRVFSWNLRKHRYETAYREHHIFGLLPASVGHENFEKLGDEPTFTIHVRGQDEKNVEEKYRLEGVIVKRVLAPGESPAKVAHATSLPGGYTLKGRQSTPSSIKHR